MSRTFKFMGKLLATLALVGPGLVLGQPNPPPNEPRPTPEQLMQMFDRNGDGKISRDEAPERMRQRWDQIDTDHDGFITLEELKARDARVAAMEKQGEEPARPQAGVARSDSIPGVIPGTRAYVNGANTTGRRDGRSWASAFSNLQDALAANAAEIWVAQRTYSPGSGPEATFQLHKGGALYGGFSGTETRRDQRDWQNNVTILDGKGVPHVVTGADEAVLDGFTITGGSALGGGPGGPGGGGPPGAGPRGRGGGGQALHTTPQAVMGGNNNGSGAGMLNFHASPTVRNCVFENNQAGKGGAVYNMTSTLFPPRPDANSRAPVFINCVFRHNSARGRGGGVSNDLGTAPTFLDCVYLKPTRPRKRAAGCIMISVARRRSSIAFSRAMPPKAPPAWATTAAHRRYCISARLQRIMLWSMARHSTRAPGRPVIRH